MILDVLINRRLCESVAEELKFPNTHVDTVLSAFARNEESELQGYVYFVLVLYLQFIYVTTSIVVPSIVPRATRAIFSCSSSLFLFCLDARSYTFSIVDFAQHRNFPSLLDPRYSSIFFEPAILFTVDISVFKLLDYTSPRALIPCGLLQWKFSSTMNLLWPSNIHQVSGTSILRQNSTY